MSAVLIADYLRLVARKDGSTDAPILEAAELIDELTEALQQFVNGVETHMIDSPADDILANVTRRARAALRKAQGLAEAGEAK